jgi:hypothetical protein
MPLFDATPRFYGEIQGPLRLFAGILRDAPVLCTIRALTQESSDLVSAL